MDAKTLCLGVLTLGDASGYEIKKMFEDGPFAQFQEIGFGSIYPALGKLLSDGLVRCDETPQASRPDKKVYSLTDAGREAFRTALRMPPAPDKIRSDTVFMMVFADLLDADHLAEVYDDYIAYYRARVEGMKALDPEGVSEGRLFARGLGLACYEATVSYLEANRHRLIDDTAARAEPDTGTKIDGAGVPPLAAE